MADAIAVVVGARGGSGAAMCEALCGTGGIAAVVGLGRPELDLGDEASIARAVAAVPAGELWLVINAAGLLLDAEQRPEKALRDLDAAQLARTQPEAIS